MYGAFGAAVVGVHSWKSPLAGSGVPGVPDKTASGKRHHDVPVNAPGNDGMTTSSTVVPAEMTSSSPSKHGRSNGKPGDEVRSSLTVKKPLASAMEPAGSVNDPPALLASATRATSTP